MKLEALELPLNVLDSGFKAGIAAAVAGTTALIGAMGAAVKMTFDWADQLDGLQDVMGVTNEEAAALNFTLRKSGVGAEALSKGMVILEKGLVKADGTLDTTGKALKAWGINVKDVNGKLKGQTALISDISKKYNSFATQQEKVNFLTETFGRSGAELVDFFDTLASEGGISAVEEKVKRLGLVIDPGRYEQFTRSLEELKLVGLGLAVGFTEKVMPVLEKFLEIVSGPGALTEKVKKLAGEFDKFVGNVIEGIATSIDGWVTSGGPERLTEKLVSWIENIGTGTGTQSKILTAAGHLLSAFVTAIGAVDWGKVAATLDTKLSESIDAGDWRAAGDSFTDSILSLFSRSVSSPDLKSKTSASLGQAMNQWLLGAVGATDWNQYWTAFNANFQIGLQQWVQQLLAPSAPLVWFATAWYNYFEGLKQTAARKIEEWGANTYRTVVSWVNKIIGAINSISLIDMPMIPTATAKTTVKKSGRASGGPVIAGQSYNVAEFFKPEQFTPATNGRVDKMEQNKPQPFDYDRLGSIIVTGMNQALQKAG